MLSLGSHTLLNFKNIKFNATSHFSTSFSTKNSPLFLLTTQNMNST